MYIGIVRVRFRDMVRIRLTVRPRVRPGARPRFRLLGNPIRGHSSGRNEMGGGGVWGSIRIITNQRYEGVYSNII